MSTETHSSSHGTNELPVHKDVAFEPRDLSPGVILRYLFYLAVVTAVSLLICVYVYRYTTKLAAEDDRPVPPSRQQAGMLYPPEPRLQGVPGHETDPQQDLRDKIKADTEANERLRWIDEKNGIAQIPVEDAMKIIAEKGLPAVPAPPAEKKQ
jgi:hypothetical protein